MAWSNFYFNSNGSNLNAGSSAADAGGSDSASVTSTNGDWDNASANRFTAASGTPFSGVTANVDWASIYPDANTTTPYIGLITAVNAGGASIDVSSTTKFGTKPSAAANGRSCKVGGAFKDLGMYVSGVALSASTAQTSSQFNYKVGTYTHTTSNIIINISPASGKAVWHRGYNSTPGDLDSAANYSVVNVPLFSFTTGTIRIGSAIFSNLSITGAPTSALAGPNGSTPVMVRCQIQNTAANANAFAWDSNFASLASVFVDCWFKATTTATQVVRNYDACQFLGCSFRGGSKQLLVGYANCNVVFCTFYNAGAVALNLEQLSSSSLIMNNTIYGSGSDAIKFVTANTGFCAILGNMFSNISGNGVNANGNASQAVLRAFNDYYTLSGTVDSGFTDTTPWYPQGPETSSPFTNGPGADLSLVAGALALSNGFPGQFENESFIGYTDIGAVQKQATGGTSIPNHITGARSIGTY